MDLNNKNNLNNLMDNKIKITVNLRNGFKFRGTIKSYDNESILLKSDIDGNEIYFCNETISSIE